MKNALTFRTDYPNQAIIGSTIQCRCNSQLFIQKIKPAVVYGS